MAVPIISGLVKLIGKLLGFAKKLNLGGKIHDLILDAEELRKMTGPEKLKYVLDKILANKDVKKRLKALQAGAVKAGLGASALYDNAFDKLKAQIEAEVAGLQALGALLPHKTSSIAGTAYAALVPDKELERLGGSV